MPSKDEPYATLTDLGQRITALRAELAPLEQQRREEVLRQVRAGSPVGDVARASGLSRQRIYSLLHRK
ncbi:helix-turn-helix domain containing protein [Corynebacterium mastitidis]|uniref:Helix-turn-helix domain-containing protein n=1 Tax=Corynebacterium mastitidis TaxID=161890 RepID=A0A2N0X997_9CORY|nr:helix-turn-helix domain-containing protein [Corynebacterium mastitidis]MCH6197257.1 helix-turn-helix domain containing protein [Corynebacterium mastitidis]PKF69259.1 hypothetical protein CXB45_02805 [Corynebacterium mastitidis]